MESKSVPTSVKVFGILHTVFGSFGLVTSPINFLNFNKTIDIYESLGLSALTINWLKISIFLAPVLAIITLALGIGLLMKKPWSRSGAVTFGYVSIALAVIGGILTAIGFSGSMGSNDPNAGAMAIGGLVGGLFGALFGSIYPLLTIIFLSKPAVKEALDRRAS